MNPPFCLCDLDTETGGTKSVLHKIREPNWPFSSKNSNYPNILSMLKHLKLIYSTPFLCRMNLIMQSHFAGEPYIWNHTQSFRGNIMYFFSTLYYFCAFNFPVFHVSLCSICFHQNFYCDLFLLLHAGLARLVDSPRPHQDAKLSAPWPRSFCDVSELLIAFKCWASSGCKP